MKTLSCKDMGDATCDFVAKGETDQEVMDMMMAHVKEKHADVMQKMDMGQMKSKMMSKIKTE
jgi:predicted small metal-binding protein